MDDTDQKRDIMFSEPKLRPDYEPSGPFVRPSAAKSVYGSSYGPLTTHPTLSLSANPQQGFGNGAASYPYFLNTNNRIPPMPSGVIDATQGSNLGSQAFVWAAQDVHSFMLQQVRHDDNKDMGAGPAGPMAVAIATPRTMVPPAVNVMTETVSVYHQPRAPGVIQDAQQKGNVDSSESRPASVESQSPSQPPETVVSATPLTIPKPWDKANQCTICGKMFTRVENVKRHMLTHSDDRPHSCILCGKSFRVAQHLKTHMTTHSGERPHVCQVCNKAFTTMSSLKRHLTIHDDEKKFKCNFCPKSYAEPKLLKLHMMSHTGERPHTCTQCGRGFKLASHLRSHIRTHSGHRPYMCPVCNKRFSESGSVKRHIISTHSDHKPYSCNFCVKGFADHSQLKLHNLCHTNERPHRCHICGKNFKLTHHLKSHLNTHTGARIHICTLCGKKFTEGSSLKRHVLAMHCGIRPHICQLCGKGFNKALQLQLHTMSHSSLRPHKCPVCHKGFKLETHVKSHMKTHTGEKGHQCRLCEKRYTEGSSLRRHMLMHTGERPFTCEFCKKGFTDRTLLRLHILSHTNERPHKCATCEKTYKLKSHLKSHIKRTHGSEFLATIETETSHATTSISGGEGFSQSQNNMAVMALLPGADEKKREEFGGFVTEPLSSNSTTSTPDNGIPPENIRLHPCLECGRIFTRKISLDIHKMAHASPDFTSGTYRVGGINTPSTHRLADDHRIRTCNICGKTFPWLHSLKMHMLLHTGERPHACTACDKRFRLPQQLKTHMAKAHAGDRPYRCHHCHKGFFKEHHLKRHVAKHAAPPTAVYVCHICQQPYPEKRLLDEHLLHGHLKEDTMGTSQSQNSMC